MNYVFRNFRMIIVIPSCPKYLTHPGRDECSNDADGIRVVTIASHCTLFQLSLLPREL